MSDPSWNHTLLILHAVTSGICGLGLIFLLYKFCFDKNRICSSIEFFSVSAISMFGLSSLAIAIYYSNLIDAFKLYMIIDIWELLQAGGNAFTYLLFIKRTFIAFNKTKYQFSKCIYAMLYLFISFFIIIQLIHMLVNYIFYSEVNDMDENIITSVFVSESQYNTTRSITIWLSAFIDIILSIIFLSLLFRALWRLTVDIGFVGISEPQKLRWATRVSQHGHSIGVDDISLNENQELIINAIAKISVLSTFSIVSAQILLLWLGIMFSTANAMSFHYYMIYLPFRAIANMICIILSFEFMKKKYELCCGCCDDFCGVLCERISKQKLKKSIKRELRLTLLYHQDDNIKL